MAVEVEVGLIRTVTMLKMEPGSARHAAKSDIE